MDIFQESAVPAAAVLVGFISLGAKVVQVPEDCAVHPMRTDTTVDPLITPFVVIVMVLEFVIEVPPPHAEVGKHKTSVGLVVVMPLKENPVAEGDAILLPDPGKVKTIFPPEGIELIVVNLIV